MNSHSVVMFWNLVYLVGYSTNPRGLSGLNSHSCVGAIDSAALKSMLLTFRNAFMWDGLRSPPVPITLILLIFTGPRVNVDVTDKETLYQTGSPRQ